MEVKDKKWLSPDEFFEEFGIPKDTQSKFRMLKNRVDKDGNKKDGILPFSKINGHIRYKRVEIEQWLEKGKVKY